MRYAFRRRFADKPVTSEGIRGRRSRRCRPGLEGLEARVAMSLGAAAVLNPTPASILGTASASSAGGSSAAVWAQLDSAGVSQVLAQRYVRVGALSVKAGAPVVVDLNLNSNVVTDSSPSAAFDGQGRLVVTWTQTIFSNASATRVVGRRFDASGKAVGAEFIVAGTAKPASDSHVAADAAGDFVVSYTIAGGTNSSNDVLASLYNTGGSLVTTVAVAAGPNGETHSGVAMTPDGRFDVAYEYAFSPTDHDVYLKRFANTGAPLGLSTVAASVLFESAPSVSVDDGGNAVVAYQKQQVGGGIFVEARRVNSSGFTAPNEITIAGNNGFALTPSVAVSRSGGAFVVAYITTPTTGGEFNIPTVYVTEVNAGDKVTGTFSAGAYEFAPAVSIDGSGHYLLTYQSRDGSASTAYARSGALPQFTLGPAAIAAER
jgi:hypothetical protein